MTRKFHLAAILWACLCPGCSESASELPPFAHYAAVARGLERAGARVLASVDGTAPAVSPVEPAEISGLVRLLARSSGPERELALESIDPMGDAAVPFLAVIAARTEQDPAQRSTACELLARIGSRLATEHLLQLCERTPDSRVRAHAAWRLAEVEQDWVVPRLILRLKYELDEDCQLWLAHALASHGNYSGLKTLWELNSEGSSTALRSSAREQLQQLAETAGAGSPEELWRLWHQGDAQHLLRSEESSALLERALWEEIASLAAGDQRAPADLDAHFVLSRMGPRVAEPLAQALHDQDLRVRLGAARCLSGMGARAALAGPALVQALADATLASAAASALGSVAYPGAEPFLRRLLANEHESPELRRACAVSLGRIGLGASVEVLEEVLDSGGPHQLRQDCACALVELGLGSRAADFLFESLSRPEADRLAAEEALGKWLARSDSPLATQLYEDWQALEPLAGLATREDQQRERIRKRRALLADNWNQLKGR